MSDVRGLLAEVTDHAPETDPVAAVRRRVARRRRAHLALAGAGTTVAVVAVAVVAVAAPGSGTKKEATTVSAQTPPQQTPPGPLPSGGAVRASAGPDSGIDRQPRELVALGALVTEHPEAFVGMYVTDDGVAVAVFGADADPTAWAARLRDAAGVQAWRSERCGYTHDDLVRVQQELATFGWPSGRPAFGAHIDAASCSVRVVTGPLAAADQDALRERFGDRVTVDTSGRPSRR